jgi:septal ring factor EnvC (AmiA/AmiB activator)
MRTPLLASLLILTFTASPVFAEAPTPPKKERSLSTLREKVEAEKARQKELDKQAEIQQKELKDVKKNLIKTADAVQKNEKSLQQLEQEIAVLRVKRTKIAGDLNKDRESLSGLIIALERIRRLPPETLVARPGAPRETAQAATALSAILPELNRRAEELKVRIAELNVLEASLEKNQAELKVSRDQLKSEKVKMDTLVVSRAKLFEATQNDIKVQQKAVADATREAKNFEELIAKVERQNRLAEKERLKKKQKSRLNEDGESSGRTRNEDERTLAATLPSLGAAQLPVSGIVKARYGEKDDIGAVSEGIRIEGRPDAVVVAPMGGIVRYAGDFKSYGNIILLEHKNNYHSLIAGLNRIDTVVGQSVDSGEPIGSLGTRSGSRPTLYYELRLNGKPVNPARKFTDLGT